MSCPLLFVLISALAPTAGAGGLAFRSHPPSGHTRSSTVQSGSRSARKTLPSIPAGVMESRVRAAAAEWLLLHACLRGGFETAGRAPTTPDIFAQAGTDVLANAGTVDKASFPEDLDLFALLQSYLSPFVDELCCNPSLHVEAMGMTDLPPEVSPMQLYEHLAATEHLLLELDKAGKALQADSRNCGVRSGFRGGVEAIRGNSDCWRGNLRKRERLASQYTRIYRSIETPLLCKAYRAGDDSAPQPWSGLGQSERWGGGLGGGAQSGAQYLRGGSGGWGCWGSRCLRGVSVRRVPGPAVH